jgi:hypothetical protein
MNIAVIALTKHKVEDFMAAESTKTARATPPGIQHFANWVSLAPNGRGK